MNKGIQGDTRSKLLKHVADVAGCRPDGLFCGRLVRSCAEGEITGLGTQVMQVTSVFLKEDDYIDFSWDMPHAFGPLSKLATPVRLMR